MYPAPHSVNHRSPSGPAAIPVLSAPPLFSLYILNVPDELTSPMFAVRRSTNQRDPSPAGPAVIPTGSFFVGVAYSVVVPLVVIFPILSLPSRPGSVNHILPGPAVIPHGRLPVGREYSRVSNGLLNPVSATGSVM